MKLKTIGFVLIFLFIGCATSPPPHIDYVLQKWGPPGKVEDRGETIVYFYYFHKSYGGATVIARRGVGVGSGSATYGVVVVEITTDRTGKILSKRKYWKQPEG